MTLKISSLGPEISIPVQVALEALGSFFGKYMLDEGRHSQLQAANLLSAIYVCHASPTNLVQVVGHILLIVGLVPDLRGSHGSWLPVMPVPHSEYIFYTT